MADEPQPPLTQGRDPKTGRILPGHTLNPSGEPAWLSALKARLREGSLAAADYLNRVVKGEETFVTVVGKDATEVTLPVMPKDRIAAVKVMFEYLVPKPKEPQDPASTQSRTALAERILARLAGLDS